jgi:hypothetical protein
VSLTDRPGPPGSCAPLGAPPRFARLSFASATAATFSNDSMEVSDDRRARDLPDPLGDFNEIQRIGPTIGGTGGTGF